MKNNLELIQLDSIELSNNVMVSDPCYRIGTWCQIQLDNIKPGKYEAYIVKSDEGEWGKRCSSLIVKHVDMKIDCETEFYEHEGEVGVDSGQAGIFDMSIYPENPHTRTGEDIFYEDCCNKTLSKISCGTLSNKKGIVSSSGYGDGGYPLYYSKDENDQIDYMHIVFIGPELEYEKYENDSDFDLAYKEELESHLNMIHKLILN